MIGKRPQAKPCEAINGIVAEGEETIENSAKARRSIPVWLQPAK
jgi:ferritin-like metal-binding protein YciE